MGLPGGPGARKTKKGDPFLVNPGSQEGHFLVQFGAFVFVKLVFVLKVFVLLFGGL